MTLKHMRIFVTVYREMNVTRAADLLHMTQPAVSRSIQELENYYGIRLFERINHRLYRTKGSEAIYARALHIVNSFDEMEMGIKNWDEFGILRVGSSITLGNYFLPGIIETLHKSHPNLQIRAMISKGRNVYEAILDDKIDLAVVEGYVPDEFIHKEPIREDQLNLIVPPGHPLTVQSEVFIKDLVQYPLLMRESGSVGRMLLDRTFAMHGLPLVPSWESASTQALVHGVARGLGIAILPKQLIQSDITSGTVVSLPVSDETFIRKNYLIWHKQKYLTKMAQEFISLCRNETTL